MVTRNPNSPGMDESEQGVLSKSFNPAFEVLQTLGLGYYSVGDILLPFAVDADGKLHTIVDSITVGSLPLPSGAATEAKQDTGNSSLSSIDTKLSSQATAAKQDTGNSSLADILAKLILVKDTDGIKKILDTVTVSGSVSVSNMIPAVETGLATSAKQLPDGHGVVEASASDIKTSVQAMDDWDESDRAKVNIIAGQAGVDGNSGNVSDKTQRVVLATNVALPTGTNILGKLGIDQTTPGTTNGVQILNTLVPSQYDYISLSYTGSNLTGVVFKTGGSGGATVATLTLAYTGSDLTSVTKT